MQELKGEAVDAFDEGDLRSRVDSSRVGDVLINLCCAELLSGCCTADRHRGHVGWRDRSSLTGDWDGARDELEDKGIMLRAHFVTESAANPSGGKSQTARYTRQVDFGADLDLGCLVGAHGGTIQITFNDRVGHSLSADEIGNAWRSNQAVRVLLPFFRDT